MVLNKEEASHLRKVGQDDMDEFQIQSMQETEVRCKQRVPSSLLLLPSPPYSLLFSLYSSKLWRNDSSCHRDSPYSPLPNAL